MTRSDLYMIKIGRRRSGNSTGKRINPNPNPNSGGAHQWVHLFCHTNRYESTKQICIVCVPFGCFALLPLTNPSPLLFLFFFWFWFCFFLKKFLQTLLFLWGEKWCLGVRRKGIYIERFDWIWAGLNKFLYWAMIKFVKSLMD